MYSCLDTQVMQIYSIFLHFTASIKHIFFLNIAAAEASGTFQNWVVALERVKVLLKLPRHSFLVRILTNWQIHFFSIIHIIINIFI